MRRWRSELAISYYVVRRDWLAAKEATTSTGAKTNMNEEAPDKTVESYGANTPNQIQQGMDMGDGKLFPCFLFFFLLLFLSASSRFRFRRPQRVCRNMTRQFPTTYARPESKSHIETTANTVDM